MQRPITSDPHGEAAMSSDRVLDNSSTASLATQRARSGPRLGRGGYDTEGGRRAASAASTVVLAELSVASTEHCDVSVSPAARTSKGTPRMCGSTYPSLSGGGAPT